MKNKPLIYWIALFTEIEYDLYQLSKLTNKFDLRLCSLTKDMEGFGVTKWTNYSDAKKIVLADKTKADNISERLEVLKRVANENPDLIILRYGSGFEGYQDRINKIMIDQNFWLWCSEQGVSRRKQEGIIAGGFNNVLANNKVDQKYYQNKFPKKKIGYLPFGCVPQIHKRVKPKPEYMCDCIADGTPKYYSDKTIYKKQSIDTMIMPLVGKVDLGLWGKGDGKLGWKAIPGLSQYYKGEYLYDNVAEVYSSCKIYLGISNNWFHGGYGKKLATALACGIFVIWHETPGIHGDFEYHKNLMWSPTPKETLILVEHYLRYDDARERLAINGQKYAYEKLSWEKNLLKIVEETT